jgi:uncharacterized DUF497 family protein
MRFEWDAAKNEINVAKHGIHFELAALVFGTEGVYIYRSDRRGEERYTAVGRVNGRLIAVAYTDRIADNIQVRRIISARRAQDREIKKYDAQSR